MATPTDLDPWVPWLRHRVAALRASTVRRTFPGSVEVVGPPEAAGSDLSPTRCAGDGRLLDRGLRVDVLCRLMPCTPGEVAVVVVRPGHHETPTETDRAWVGAAFAAAGVRGQQLIGVVLVSRWGWLDLLSGQRRSWKRLRIRGG